MGIKGKPCKVTEITSSKTGKHGHAKCHIVALDIFTSKKYEDLCPASHNMSIPFVKRVELQCLTADPDTGEVSLLLQLSRMVAKTSLWLSFRHVASRRLSPSSSLSD